MKGCTSCLSLIIHNMNRKMCRLEISLTKTTTEKRGNFCSSYMFDILQPQYCRHFHDLKILKLSDFQRF